MSTQTAEGTQFDSELKKTELGNVISDNKGLFAALLVVIFAGAIGFGFYQKSLEKKNEEASKAFYLFSSDKLEKFKKGEVKADEVVSSFKSTMSKYSSSKSYIGSALIVFDAVNAKAESEEVYSLLDGLTGQNIYQIYALSMRKAAALENMKKYDEAIAALNLINSDQFKSVEGKVNLDLGRLHMLKGSNEQARTHFDKVLKINTQAEFKSLATYYLSKLN
ncbi:MAG: hypothetical protein CME69_04215 [Halobacteriovorax sp.]|nr:hypothetical protein [Halobacteriovorax sp.]MEE3078629.1 tetratricopeptide repeat protein [Bdellovibrionota bacterium]